MNKELQVKAMIEAAKKIRENELDYIEGEVQATVLCLSKKLNEIGRMMEKYAFDSEYENKYRADGCVVTLTDSGVAVIINDKYGVEYSLKDNGDDYVYFFKYVNKLMAEDESLCSQHRTVRKAMDFIEDNEDKIYKAIASFAAKKIKEESCRDRDVCALYYIDDIS